MKKQILGFVALASAITTTVLLFNQNQELGLSMSAVTTILVGLVMRTQRPTAAVAVEKKAGMKLIDDLNERLNLNKQQIQNMQAKIAKLEGEAKDSGSEDAAVLLFLRVLQEKSRLLDFALTDIAKLPDPQVGAAARVVHQGLRSLLQDSFAIAPIAGESEGQILALPDDFDSTRYRILQQTAAEQKPEGVVLHRGWEAKKMNLPRSMRRSGDPLPSVLAPVEIEARGI